MQIECGKQSCFCNYKFIETTFRPLKRCLTLNIINVCFRFFSISHSVICKSFEYIRLHTQLTLLSIKCKYCGSFASAQLQFAVVPYEVVVVATAVCVVAH